MSPALRRSVLLATAVALIGPTVAHAALLWTMTANPLTVSTGSTTNFGLTALNPDPLTRIRCIVIDVPDNFNVTATSAFGVWSSSYSGNRVRVQGPTGIGRLQSVTFTVRAFALRADELAWPANAYSRADCGGAGSLLGVPPIVVVLGPAVTPTPSPTAVPTPTPTPRPTPNPTPRPTPTPELPAPSTPSPSFPPGTAPTPGSTVMPPVAPGDERSPESTPGPVQTDQPAAESSPDPVGTTPAASSSSPSAIDDDGAPPVQPPRGGGIVAADRSGASAGHAPVEAGARTDDVRVALGPLGLLGGVNIWAIPGLIIGLPGLLLIAFIVLQMGGALVWIPAIRRLGRGSPTASASPSI